MPMIKKTNKPLYWFTVAWDGYDENSEGSVSYARETFDDAINGIKYYIDKYKDRSPYVAGLAFEKDHISQNLLTDRLRKTLNRSNNG